MKRSLLTGALAVFLFSTAGVSFAEAATYKVQSGETLYSIAKKHNVSVSDIKGWNKLKSDSLSVNQSLTIGKAKTQPAKKAPAVKAPAPAKAKPAVKAPAPVKAKPAAKTPAPAKAQPAKTGSSATVHKVQKGDTLSKISVKYGVTIAQLTGWNNLKSTNIFIGQSLNIKGAKTAAPATPTVVPVSKPAAAPVKQTPVYEAVVATAHSLQGIPYKFGGTTPAGFDCSGFIHYVYSQSGVNIGRDSSQGYFNKSTTVSNPAYGDLVFFENTYKPGISHMGIYVGNNSFIHAGSKGIEVTSLNDSYWSQHFVGFKRFNSIK